MIAEPDFQKCQGLIPAIAQDFLSHKVLMLAWMNPESWKATLKEGYAVYWSRSKNRLWRKGEVSGNVQLIKNAYLDCDRDSILLMVEQRGGAACHTGHESCFFQEILNGSIVVKSRPLFDPEIIYGRR